MKSPMLLTEVPMSEILPRIKQQVITYGFSPRADFQISGYYFTQGASFMKIKHKNLDLGEYMLAIPGKHNMLNALSAIIASDQIGASRYNIKKYLPLYQGCKRRFEKVGQFGNVLLYDDYAHHPSEIIATLSSIRQWFRDRRIIILFQPHTFSRTKTLISEFSKSFSQADLALICDIYPSAREKIDNTINSNMLVLEINKYKKNAYYLRDKEEVFNYLKREVKERDLIMTIGAGDIYLWHEELKKLLSHKFI